MGIGWILRILEAASGLEGDLEIEPEFNSIALFDVAARTEHHITPVQACAGGDTFYH